MIFVSLVLIMPTVAVLVRVVPASMQQVTRNNFLKIPRYLYLKT